MGSLSLISGRVQLSAGKENVASGQKLYLQLNQLNALHDVMLKRSANLS